jgi:hypothetical protein
VAEFLYTENETSGPVMRQLRQLLGLLQKLNRMCHYVLQADIAIALVTLWKLL